MRLRFSGIGYSVTQLFIVLFHFKHYFLLRDTKCYRLHKSERETVQKRRPHKIAKNWPSISAKCPHWLTPLSMRTHQRIRSFCTKKCERPHLKNVPGPYRTNPLPRLNADVFYGQPQIVHALLSSKNLTNDNEFYQFVNVQISYLTFF